MREQANAASRDRVPGDANVLRSTTSTSWHPYEVWLSRRDGSFGQTCRDLSVDSNGTLTAICRTINGTSNRSSLSLRECGSRRAGNRDGALFCER